MITNNTFCYWDAKSDIDTFVLLLNLLITSVILALTIVYAIRFRKTNTLRLASSKQIYGKFVAVMLWALCKSIVYFRSLSGRDLVLSRRILASHQESVRRLTNPRYDPLQQNLRPPLSNPRHDHPNPTLHNRKIDV